ncbi:MAG: hypothetical protein GC168_11800 [Candidatus Hydrogenedens sp.]|nr:hypothetical protein [Candidatus Hydrogenedens sp.]
MDAIASHFQEYWLYWAVAAVLAAPIIFVTRRYSLPVIQYALESAIYMYIMHVIIGAVVRVASWFKTSSSMRALEEDGRPTDAVNWTTPFIEFWDKAKYDPEWIIYLEIGFAVVIVILVARYRPMKIHNPHKRKYDDKGNLIAGGTAKKGGKGANRPGRSYVPPSERDYRRPGR